MNKILKLFYIFFKIGAFTFGGGYAMLPLIEEEIVHKNKWVDNEEFLNAIALAQSIPGVLAVNTATYIGYRISGLPGAIMATLGAVLPSFFIILIIVKYFIAYMKEPSVEKVFNGIRPAVAALIIAAAYKLKKGVPSNGFSYVIILLSFIFVALLGVHPILIIISSGILGYYLYRRYSL